MFLFLLIFVVRRFSLFSHASSLRYAPAQTIAVGAYKDKENKNMHLRHIAGANDKPADGIREGIYGCIPEQIRG